MRDESIVMLIRVILGVLAVYTAVGLFLLFFYY
jgi:hypothetical protein